jgi:hypothetical protein
MEAVGGYITYRRGTTFAWRTNFPDGFNDSTLTLRFGSMFAMWTE